MSYPENRDVPPTVLHLCLSPDLGGLELYVLRTISQLVSREIPSALVCAPGSKLENRMKLPGVPVTTIVRSSIYFPIIAAWKLAKYIDTTDIDIVHIHWAKDLALASLAKRLARRDVRLVYTRHMDLFSNKKDPFHRWLYRPVDLLVTVTNAMRNQVLAFLPIPPERVHMLYLGAPDVPADTKEDCYRFRAKLGIPDHSFLVGLIGRIEEPKGQHLLIDAILLLRSRGLDIRGILIGNAMNQDYYESLRTSVRSANDPESICFFGFHPHPHAIMHCFDIVVLTTRRETFGLVLIEAMNAGTAVIGSNAGGVKEIIDDEKTGLLFQSGDSASLATALRTLYDDSGYRQRLAAAGKQKAETVFSEKRHYEKLVDLYKAVLDRESDPS